MRFAALWAVLMSGCHHQASTSMPDWYQERRREADARHAEEMAASDARAESAINAHMEAQTQRRSSDAEARQKIESRIMGESAARKWVTDASKACTDSLSMAHCEAPPALATEHQKGQCATACKESIRAESLKRLESIVAACAAKEDPEPAECSLEFLRLDPQRLAAASAECSRVCKEERARTAIAAKEGPKAEAQGEALVLAYKRCMMAVDSTREARREQAYDRDLYNDRMLKADARCRVAHRCDWLEEHSEHECMYGY